MRKFGKYAIFIGILLTILFVFKGFYKDHYINLKDSKLNYSIKFKGLFNAKAFVLDKNGNYYVAYRDKVQFINSNGKSYDLIVDKNLNISSLEYYNDKLYFASDNKIICYDINKRSQNIIINDLPNYGDYKESLIKIVGEELFVTIGSATNSGVVGTDNKWLNENPFFYDLTPRNISVRGNNFGNEKTGAFVPYKTRNLKGQIIPSHFPGNGSVFIYNIKTGNMENYAWGIRNIKGMDFNSEGKLLASVGGIENRGLRPLTGDVDYIYEIKKGLWYGWPDYSGGDPVTSPRFKSENRSKTEFLLDNHPSSNPPAPLYQHKSISALGALAIDTKAQVGEKDCIYFYDNRENMLYALTKGNVLNEKAKFNTLSNISCVKIANKAILLLDSKEGILYSLNNKNYSNIFKIDKSMMYYFIMIILIGITIIVWKFSSSSKKQ